MKIDITKKRYRILLEMVDMADTVLHLHRNTDDPETQEYRELVQWFLSYSEAMGCGDVVEYDPKDKTYIIIGQDVDGWKPTDLIEEFEEDSFWDELTDRLAVRDLVQEVGHDKLAQMDRGEVFVKRMELQETYLDEFERNGLANLRLAIRLS